MKPLSEMSHYEVLEVSSDASTEELERAYRMARATWSENSLATYSVYETGDAAAMRERIELAWRVLADHEARSHYDGSLGRRYDDQPDELGFEPELDPAADDRPAARAPEVVPAITGFDDLEDADGPCDGARLRRSRLRHGVDIEQIARITKISPTYLRFIEEEQFDALPAPVYVRGFVSAYARCVGLDPARVVPAYMERLMAKRPPTPRSRRARR